MGVVGRGCGRGGGGGTFGMGCVLLADDRLNVAGADDGICDGLGRMGVEPLLSEVALTGCV